MCISREEQDSMEALAATTAATKMLTEALYTEVIRRSSTPPEPKPQPQVQFQPRKLAATG
jgi:hypothetical protein